MLQRTREASGAHHIQVIAYQSVLQTGLWHSDPFQRSLRDIPAWRRGLLSALWHGDPAHRCLSAILAEPLSELVYRIVAVLGFVKFTWHEPLLIIK